MIVREATAGDIDMVVCDMLPEDREEQFARCFEQAGERCTALYEQLQAALPMAIKCFVLLTDSGYPGALVGAFLVSPGVASVYHLRSSAWPKIARAAHRFYRRTFIPSVLAPNVRLAECLVMTSHSDARYWLSRLGFQENGRSLPYGSQGEGFVHCAWVNPADPVAP